jgi:predicted transcriptional regulator
MNKKESSKFILLSLDDDHTKNVANAVSSKSGKKILAYLEKHEKVTESQLSKGLSIPMSTVNYTIEQLSKANLIENSHYHFSTKGREVKHWRLANKLIIIAPKKTEGLYDKIKDLLGIFFLTGIGSLFYSYFFKSSFETMSISADEFVMSSPKSSVYNTESALMDERYYISDVAISDPNHALWFFVGVCVTLILVFLIRAFWKKK